MRRAVVLAWILMSVLAGCLQPSSGSQEWCELGYWVGCDENPDAVMLREFYGLHQFTNTTEIVHQVRFDEGVVFWTQGIDRWSNVSGLHFMRPLEDRTWVDRQSLGDWLQRPRHAQDSVVAMVGVGEGEFHDLHIGMNGHVRVIHQATNQNSHAISFDGTHIVHSDYGTNRNSDALLAIDVRDGRTWEVIRYDDVIFDQEAWDISALTMRDGLFWATILQDGVEPFTIEVDVVNASWREIFAEWDDSRIRDASDSYLLAHLKDDSGWGLYAVSRDSGAAVRVDDSNGHGVLDPELGGDWMLYWEDRDEGAGNWNMFAARHIPTGQIHYILPIDGSFYPASGTYDTDGESAAACFVMRHPFNTESYFPRPTWQLEPPMQCQMFWFTLPPPEDAEWRSLWLDAAANSAN